MLYIIHMYEVMILKFMAIVVIKIPLIRSLHGTVVTAVKLFVNILMIEILALTDSDSDILN